MRVSFNPKAIIAPITIFIIILLAPIIFFLNSTFYYFYQFEQKEVYENFSENYSKDFINEQFSNALEYINWRDELKSDSFWSEEDTIHLKDVRNIVSFTNFMFLLSILLSIVNYRYIKDNYPIVIKNSAIITVFFITITGILSFVDFTRAFHIFHKILFRNDYWLLDPATSNLIKYFPEIIFAEIALFIAIFVIITHVLLSIPIWAKKIVKFSSQEDI